MDNRIHALGKSAIPVPTPSVRTPAPASEPASPTPVEPSRSPLHPELSEAEDRMIRRYFPESPGMKLKLYGPGQVSRTVNPHALGQRIDLKG